MKLQIANPAAMEALGEALARHCTVGMSLFLQGELGVGKTTLVRGFLRGLGYTGVVKSPTYTLIEPYELGERRAYHFDLYRVTEPGELDPLGFRDYFDGQALSLVEWPEHAAGRLGKGDILVRIAYGPSHRDVELSAASAAGQSILHALSESPAPPS
ncbi:MAG: tRNA (adenosine(37)-N6)-threonylcarbamoyltransferase complex ATPase subunit type 1 TsaE [Gammaproteobacteria bacterium]|nr:tRNA (adenosine(37)-N6)-threonylcarbamoyltransferase complex ATPase subunit type 1 TsaE [Gammaproteobacteria bacterium]